MFRLSKISSCESLKLVTRTASLLLEDLDTPISLSIYLQLKYEEYDDIANRSIDPLSYNDIDLFNKDYQAVSILKKYEGLPSSINRQEAALKSFIEAEAKCLDTNTKFSTRSDGYEDNSSYPFSLVFEMRMKICQILGKAPEIGSLNIGFGPGATSSCKGHAVSYADKLSAKPDIAASAIAHAESYFRDNPQIKGAIFGVDNVCAPFSALDSYTVKNYNELSFVPKTCLTDRAICIEPTLNTLFQKGLGEAIRIRLRWAGIDLSKQQGINAEFAKKGSIDDSFATIDLASASDTISWELVYNVLPSDWFDLLDAFRSKWTKLPDGTFHENEKFSSMGNGYTFELETLIFYVLLLVLKRRKPHVIDEVFSFGDDMIVPTGLVHDTLDSLDKLGFIPNKSKSFWSGPFRESCGKDYYNGILVRPLFIKKEISDERNLFSIANGLRHRAYRSHQFIGSCDKAYRRAWKHISSRIPVSIRLYGPKDLGNGVLWVPRQEKPFTNVYSSHQLYRCRQLVEVSRKTKLDKFIFCKATVASLLGQNSTSSKRGTCIGLRVKNNTVISNWSWYEGEWL